MAQREWYELVAQVKSHVVRIQTPRGSGTGFFFHRLKSHLVRIATAAHVVDEAHTGKSRFGSTTTISMSQSSRPETMRTHHGQRWSSKGAACGRRRWRVD